MVLGSGAARACRPRENADAINRWLPTQAPKGFRGQALLERNGRVFLDTAFGLARDAEGKLKLSSTLGLYFDQVPKDEAVIAITHLLSHTPGVIANHPEPLARLTREEFIAWFRTTPLDHKPGTGHQCYNVGYSMLAALMAEDDGGLPGFNSLSARYTRRSPSSSSRAIVMSPQAQLANARPATSLPSE